MSRARAVRVVHVVGAMNRAGVESWLMELARNASPADVEFTFVKHGPGLSDYDDEIVALGHRLAVVPFERDPLRYALRLRRLLLRDGAPFDAVHSHVGHFTAVPMVVAWSARIKNRIAHSHSDNRVAQHAAGVARRAYFWTASMVIRRFSSLGLGSSPGACESLFRRQPDADGAVQVLPTGIDLRKYPADGSGIRTSLGVSPGTVLVGHVGRFVAVKNHEFLIEIAQYWHDADQDVHLVLAGEGPLKAQIEQEIERNGLAEIVTFVGLRADIPALLNAFDVLLLPSHYEGVPVTLLEAQASGCPSIVSTNVDHAVDVVPGLITRLSVDNSAAEWAADAVKVGRNTITPSDRAQAIATMRDSEYNIEVTLTRLRSIWSRGG